MAISIIKSRFCSKPLCFVFNV